MAPNPVTSSEALLVQAVQKLSAAITETGAAPNDFAKNLQELLEVSKKINEFDEMASAADAQATSNEAEQWREISLMTMQFARKHLVEQQQSLIEALRGKIDSGASLYKAPDANQTPMAVKPPPGLPQEAKPDQMAVKPPPGLTSPPGLSMPLKPSKVTKSKPTPPSCGLSPPPGLASAGTAPVPPPPGFNTRSNCKPSGPAPKKDASAHPWRISKKSENKFTSFFEARFENPQTANPGVINLDAYESD